MKNEPMKYEITEENRAPTPRFTAQERDDIPDYLCAAVGRSFLADRLRLCIQRVGQE